MAKFNKHIRSASSKLYHINWFTIITIIQKNHFKVFILEVKVYIPIL